MIGLEYNGEGSVQICQDMTCQITAGSTGLVFVSQSRDIADQQIHNFYDFADMQMAVWETAILEVGKESSEMTGCNLIYNFHQEIH